MGACARVCVSGWMGVWVCVRVCGEVFFFFVTRKWEGDWKGHSVEIVYGEI